MAHASLLGILSATPAVLSKAGDAHAAGPPAGEQVSPQGFAAILHAMQNASSEPSLPQVPVQSSQSNAAVRSGLMKLAVQGTADGQQGTINPVLARTADISPQEYAPVSAMPAVTAPPAQAAAAPGQQLQPATAPSTHQDMLTASEKPLSTGNPQINAREPDQQSDARKEMQAPVADAKILQRDASPVVPVSATPDVASKSAEETSAGTVPDHPVTKTGSTAVHTASPASQASSNPDRPSDGLHSEPQTSDTNILAISAGPNPAGAKNPNPALSAADADVSANTTASPQSRIAPPKQTGAEPTKLTHQASALVDAAKFDDTAAPTQDDKVSTPANPQQASTRSRGKEAKGTHSSSDAPPETPAFNAATLTGNTLSQSVSQSAPAQVTVAVAEPAIKSAGVQAPAGIPAAKAAVSPAARTATDAARSTPALNTAATATPSDATATVADPRATPLAHAGAKNDTPQDQPKGTPHTSFAEALSAVQTQEPVKAHAEGATFSQSLLSTPSQGAMDTARAPSSTTMTRVSSQVELQAPAAASTTPVRRLELSVQDPVLGTVGVQAEMRGGVVHASVTGSADAVGASLSSLHHYLNDQQVAVNSLTFHSSADRTNGTQFANSSNSGRGQDDGANASFSTDRQNRDTSRQQRQDAPFAVPDSSRDVPAAATPVTLYRGATNAAPDGSTLSIHI